MNICLLSRSFHKKRGGVETFTYRTARAYAERGHTVHILTTEGEEKFHLEGMGDRIFIHKIKYKRPWFPGYWKVNQFLPLSILHYHRLASKKVNEIVKKYNIDIVEAPDFEGFRPIFRRKYPIVVRLHGYHGMDRQFSNSGSTVTAQNYCLWLWTHWFFRKCDALISVSPYFTDLISQLFKIPVRKFVLSYLSVDQKIFYPKKASQNGHPNILFVGRHEKSKGIEDLAEAVPLVSKSIPNAKFIFVGRDTRRNEDNKSYRQHLKEKLAGYNVEFIDQVTHEELPEYFRKSTVSVFPSLYEPGGTVALEAVSCANACVVTQVGCFLDYFKDGENGLLVPPNNSKALADALTRLLKDEHLRSRISEAAYRMAKEKFDLEKIIEENLEIYKRAIDHFQGKKRA